MRRALGAIAVVGLACVVGGGGCAASDPAPRTATLTERPASSGTPANPGIAADRPIAASAAPATSDVIATVGTHTITKDALLAPMLEEHGLSFLLQLVQLDLARQAAKQVKVTVTPEDVKAERDLTFKRMLAESHAELEEKLKAAIAAKDTAAAEQIKAQLAIDPETALDAYLAQQYTVTRQYVSKTEFYLVLETNAYLRKIAEASPQLQKLVTDKTVEKAFDAQFGVKVVIRHIQARNLEQITAIRRRLEAGDNFAQVAMDLSTNANSAPNGGAVRPFTMNDPDISKVLKEAAFNLGKDEVSETIHADNAFHILKLENRIAPKVVKFEDVKERLREGLMAQVSQAGVKQLRDKIARQALANMRIENPVLKRQFEERREKQRVQAEQLDEQMKRDRALTAPGAEQPAAEPTTEPAPPADGEEEGAAPPDDAASGATPADPATPAADPGAASLDNAGEVDAGATAPAAPAAPAAKPKATKPARASSPAAPAKTPRSPADNNQ